MATIIEEKISCQKELAEEITRLLRNFKKDGPERKTQDYLAKRLKELESYWADFNKIHEQLKELLTKEHPYFKEKLHDKTYGIYKAAVELISNYSSSQPLITNLGAMPKSVTSSESTFPSIIPTATTTTITSTSIASNVHQHITPYIDAPSSNQAATANLQNFTNASQFQEANRLNNLPKLPPIKIPKFSGNYKEWKSFIDIFTNVIHNNFYLSNVEKMQYLLYHLEGDARRVIGHLQLNNDNYNTALQLIQARFNNNRKIITTYVNAIMDAKSTGYRSQEDIITLYDLIRECLEALKNLHCKTDEWGPMIVCIAMRKLDPETLRLFEESLCNPREMPSINELLNFLEKRHQVLDCIKNSRQNKSDITGKHQKRAYHTTLKRSCSMCGKEHNIYQCPEFRSMDPEDRHAFIMQKKLCLNCLVHSKGEKCKSNKSCAYCKKKHHTLLHRNTNNNSATKAADQIRAQETPTTDVISLHVSNTKFPNVLLPTAIVRVKNLLGQTELLRALIDPGSQVSLITENAVQMLKLQKQRVKATIMGVGESESTKTQSKVTIKIQPRFQTTSLSLEAFVLPTLSSLIPETPATGIDMRKYGNIMLADPTFDTPAAIDLLLGADVYANILTEGFKPGPPAAQNTKLGWILFGSIPNTSKETTRLSSFLSLAELDEKLEQFWETHDNTSSSSQADEECEEHFENTYKRDEEGRYVVRLPFKPENGELGQSRNKALARLMQMEKKLRKEPQNMLEYNKFLSEYLELGHMSLAKQRE